MKRCFLIVVALSCCLCLRAGRPASRVLPDAVAEQYGRLYVSYQGRVCQLRNICSSTRRTEQLTELFYQSQTLAMFPYADGDTVRWLTSVSVLPEGMPADEQNFVRKLPDYMQELDLQMDFDALADVIAKLGVYQQQRGGDTLPTPFVDALDSFYAGRVHDGVRWVFLFCGLLLMSCFFRERIGDENYHLPRAKLMKGCRIYTLVAFVYVGLLFAIRWIVGGHVPMTTGYEVMLFLVWCILLMGLVGSRRHGSALPTSLLACVVAVPVMGLFDASIGVLPAALDSPLLGFHVAVIIFSYALFALMALNGLRGMLKRCRGSLAKSDELAAINKALLTPGVVSLAVGIVLGSFWAKTAWGAYWSWDPKETWSLVTLVVYGMGFMPWLRSAKAFHVFAMVAFLFVLFTYFGVNYVLGGMHAYV